MSADVLWLVQTNLGSESDVVEVLPVLRGHGAAYVEVSLTPMTDELPDVDHDGPVVCYGSTSFVTAAARSGRWSPGTFFDEARFTYGAWAEGFGPLLLNDPSECERTTIGALAAMDRPDDETVFLRPERDLKEFNGEVLTVGKAREWAAEVARGVYPLIGPGTPVVIGPPHGISAEWRVFMVDGVAVTGSQYRDRGRPRVVPGLPDDVVAFAESAAERWSPAPVFVLDLARSGPGLYVVEAQCFNSAGFYGADLRLLFEAVGRHAQATHARETPAGP